MTLPRRDALRLLGAAPLALGFTLGPAAVAGAAQQAARAVRAAARGKVYTPRFFTAHEWKTVRLLADYVIPRDERSGSATDAGVPEFIDYILTDPQETERGRESRQTAMRGGLGWIDTECRRLFGRPFVEAAPARQVELLDAVAYAEKKGPGTSFFSSFRDLVASGFWTSRMGILDLGFQGNVPVLWQGPPPEVLRKLGLED
jgi:gluconate 2-dehydrogenase gamma chain